VILPSKASSFDVFVQTPRLLIILSSYLLHPADRWSICNGKSGSGDKSPEIAVIWNSPPTGPRLLEAGKHFYDKPVKPEQGLSQDLQGAKEPLENQRARPT